jgi:hypothetical protein
MRTRLSQRTMVDTEMLNDQCCSAQCIKLHMVRSDCGLTGMEEHQRRFWLLPA